MEVLNRLETFALFVSAVTLSSCSFFFLSSQLDMEEDTALQGHYEQAVSAAVVGLSAALFAWCGIVIARDLTGRIKLPGLGLRRGGAGLRAGAPPPGPPGAGRAPSPTPRWGGSPPR